MISMRIRAIVGCGISWLLACIGCGDEATQARGTEAAESRGSSLSAATRYSIAAVQPLTGDANTYAFAINDSGAITGLSAANLSTLGHAIRLSPGGKTQDLGTLPSGASSKGSRHQRQRPRGR